MTWPLRNTLRALALAIGIACASPGGPAAAAPALQEGTATPSAGEYLARVHPGSCAETTLLPDLATGPAILASEPESATQSWALQLQIDLMLPEIIAGPHAITIERVDGDITTPIACADIAGKPDAGALVLGLTAIDTGVLVGVATLSSGDAGDTNVVVYLILAANGDPLGATGEDDTGTDDVSGDESDATDDDEAAPEGGV